MQILYNGFFSNVFFLKIHRVSKTNECRIMKNCEFDYSIQFAQKIMLEKDYLWRHIVTRMPRNSQVCVKIDTCKHHSKTKVNKQKIIIINHGKNKYKSGLFIERVLLHPSKNYHWWSSLILQAQWLVCWIHGLWSTITSFFFHNSLYIHMSGHTEMAFFLLWW